MMNHLKFKIKLEQRVLYIIILFSQIICGNEFDFLQKITDFSDCVIWYRVIKNECIEKYKYHKNGCKLITGRSIDIIGRPEKIIKGDVKFLKKDTIHFKYTIGYLYVFDSLGNVIGSTTTNGENPELKGELFALPDSCYLCFFNLDIQNKDTIYNLKRLDFKERVCALKSYIKKLNDIENYCKCTPGILTGETTIEEELGNLKKQLEEESKK